MSTKENEYSESWMHVRNGTSWDTTERYSRESDKQRQVIFPRHDIPVRNVRNKDVEDGKYAAWETAYREVIETLGHSKNDDATPLQKAKYKPNLGLVYEGFDWMLESALCNVEFVCINLSIMLKVLNLNIQ